MVNVALLFFFCIDLVSFSLYSYERIVVRVPEI